MICREEELARRGIAFTVIITPSKASEYEQYIPDWYKAQNTEPDSYVRPVTRLLTMLDERNVNVIDCASYYDEIEVMSCQKIEATMTALSNLSNYVIQKLAYSQIQEQLARKSEELLIAENQLKQAKLDALQKQVTPHFIFNVLNSVSRLLSMRDYSTRRICSTPLPR